MVVSGQVVLSEDGVPTNTEDYQVYQISEGESLRELAERFLGNPEALPELLQFNRITNPAMVKPGSLIIIPGKSRDKALEAIAAAEASLQKSLEAESEVYAKNETKDAQESLKAARIAQQETNYGKVLAFAELTVIKADRARLAADDRAMIHQEGTLSQKIGLVEVSHDEGRSWLFVKKTEKVPVKSILRTGENSRAEVMLADGSRVQVMSGSEFQISSYLLDQRTGARNSRLKVILGEILSRIEPKKEEEGDFEVETEGASISVRGTAFLVSYDEESEVTTVSVIEGSVNFNSAGDDVALSKGQGAVSKKGHAPEAPAALLAPPEGLIPGEEGLLSARQRVELAWHDVENVDALDVYQVEIARDEEFSSLVEEYFTAKTTVTSSVLDEGQYYWRIASIADNGVKGLPSKAGKFKVEKKLDVKMKIASPTLKRGGKLVVGPELTLAPISVAKDTSVVQMEVAIDEAPFQLVDNKPLYVEGGKHVVKLRGISADGDVGEIIETEVYVDAFPPRINMSMNDPDELADLGEYVIVTLKAKDDTKVDHVEFSLNKKPFRIYEQPFKVDLGRTSLIQYRAIDVVGNVSPTKSLEMVDDVAHKGRESKSKRGWFK